MRVLLLGATGVTGRRAAAELLRSSEVDEVVLSGRHERSLGALAELFGGDRVGIAVCDVADETTLQAHARAADVVVSCAGPGYLTEAPSIRACIAAGSSYLSLNDDQFEAAFAAELGDAAQKARATIVPGAGVSPGLSDLLAASAVSDLDNTQEIEISLAVSSSDDSGEASALHLLAALSRPAHHLSEGRHLEDTSGKVARLVYFPEPVGWVETFRIGHPQVLTLHRAFPNVASLGFRLGVTERAVMDVLRASARSGMAGSDTRRRMLLSVASPLRGVLEKLPPRSGSWTALRVDVWGSKDGRKAEISLGMVDHLVNLACLPLILAALEVGAGRAVRPGVRSLAEVVPVDAFFTALDRRGIRAARLEPVAV